MDASRKKGKGADFARGLRRFHVEFGRVQRVILGEKIVGLPGDIAVLDWGRHDDADQSVLCCETRKLVEGIKRKDV